jgi:hypothetical protein
VQRVKIRQQELLEPGKFKKIVFLIPELRFRLANPADRILDFSWLKVLTATLVTFIAPGLGSTVRTDPFYVPVREKSPALRAICLVHNLFVDIAFPDEFGYN